MGAEEEGDRGTLDDKDTVVVAFLALWCIWGELLTSLLPFSYWRGGGLMGSTSSSPSLCWTESPPWWGLGRRVCRFMVFSEQVLLDLTLHPPTWQPLVTEGMLWLLSSLFIWSFKLLRTWTWKRGTLYVEI